MDTIPDIFLADGIPFISQIALLFLNTTSDAVIALDSRGNIHGWNSAAEKIYGYGPQEVSGKTLSFLFGEEEFSQFAEKLSTGRAMTGWETTQRHKNGSIVHTSIDVSPLLAGDSTFSGNCVIVKEIARYRMLQSQLRRTQKLEAVGRLSGGIAHDFNNLLTVIAGYNGMLLAELPADSGLRSYATEVQKAAERATMLTNQLLAFSRREVTQAKALSLNEMIEDLDKMLGRIIGEDIKLVFALGTELDNIKADPGQISQILTNLVVNARDAMPSGGSITIATENIEFHKPQVPDEQDLAPGPYVKLTISDTGSGMDEQTRQHLFEPFFTTKPAGKGTGLGLSIVFGIVSQLCGGIRVLSEPGAGTTFTICLPTTTEQKAEKRAVYENFKVSKTPEITVLLVEDDRGVRHLVRQMLLNGGYVVYETSDPHEALRIGETIPVNLLLTDVLMPGMNGRVLADAMTRADENLKVIYMSGYLEDSILPLSSLEPGSCFIRKPFTAAHLYQQIKTMLTGRGNAAGISGESSARTMGGAA